ncbi:MAG: hypothetical protein HRU20_15760 [Pseudomonadales bacterium]|nr:hypothetical protein [Pseudomonadales bacterium]
MFLKYVALGINIVYSLLIFSLSVNVQADNQDTQRKRVNGCQQTTENENFVNFESGQVRTLALSKNGKRLFVANTPANCLEIYDTTGRKLRRVGAVHVGLEPVAVAIRNEREVWVVNHLSDSVSIVDVQGTPRVKRTLLVGDEPRDIVFAGSEYNRAFISTAHRGQNHTTFKFEDLRKPGIGRADIFVFDADNLGDALGGKPLKVVSLFADTPRALTATSDGSTVYAAAFFSGNQTTTIAAQAVKGEKPLPHHNYQDELAPDTGLIVKYNNEDKQWIDETGRDWTSKVRFDLPDKDVFKIDANSTELEPIRAYRHVGTTLFNMAVNPVNGTVYVSNTDARNEVRFEGIGNGVRGHTVENRITLINNKGLVQPVHLNPHVDFDLPFGEYIDPEEKAKSLAQPENMIVSDDGERLFVSAFGSNKIAILSTEDLENDDYVPDASDHIIVPAGPTGLVLNDNGTKAYVYSRFDNVVSEINIEEKKVEYSVSLYNPEPEFIKKGRRFLYDADYTSSNGTNSCGSCHIFGDNDALAWDLGNPNAAMQDNELPESPGNLAPLKSKQFHPMKGPMTTQTFRGMVNSGAMHWRGDHMGLDPEEGESQEEAAFKEFNIAFMMLLGRKIPLNPGEMQAFTDFALSITSAPNPIRNLDNTLTEDQAQGQIDYLTLPVTGGVGTCKSCHALNRGNNLFGTDKGVTSEGPGVSQDFKVSHLRNMYSKIGMFGSSFSTTEHMGDQVRGYGYLHDGSIATVDDFLTLFEGVFQWQTTKQQQNVTDFLMVFDTEHMPVLGQQVTLSRRNAQVANTRVDLLEEQAKSGACTLVASGLMAGRKFFATMQDNGSYATENWMIPGWLLRLSTKITTQEMTYTCMPPQYKEAVML